MKVLNNIAVTFDDPLQERVRLNHEQRITDLQTSPAAQMVVLGNFTVPNGGTQLVPHNLGRRPKMVVLSPPQAEAGVTGGSLVDLVGADVDRTKLIRLFATGYGGPVTVTVSVL